ncbi:MAG: aspartate aminotransferase family protein [Elusimicrobiota bacterium]
MAIDIGNILAESRGRNFSLFSEHIHPQWAKLLRTIGFNRTYVKAEGAYLFDDRGNKYLDFLAGWGTFNFGRNHPDIKRALRQLLEADFPGWIAFDAPALAGVLAEKLISRMPGDLRKVYFCSSGTECAETAIKFARAATGRERIIHLKRAFHGLTTGALSINGDASFRAGFGALLPSSEVPLNDLEALERSLAQGDAAGFIFEPVQGKGIFIPEKGYLLEAQRLCRKYGALFICDEVQTGMGRTGRFLGIEWEEGVAPDIVLLAKALSGGFVPVGAVIMRDSIYKSVFNTMGNGMIHSTTFGMGNMAMAAGLASLQVLDDYKLLENARRMGALFREGLEAMRPRFALIKEIRQRGLMVGIEFGKPDSIGLKSAWSMIHRLDKDLFTQAVVIPLFDDHRILTQVAGHHLDVLKLSPPLTISEQDVRWFLHAFERCMVNLHKFPGPVWELARKLGKNAVTAVALRK